MYFQILKNTWLLLFFINLVDILKVATRKGLIAKEDSHDKNGMAYGFIFYCKKKKKGGDIEIELKPGYASQPKTASQ